MTPSLGISLLSVAWRILAGSRYQKVVDNPKYISFLCIHASHHLWELTRGWGLQGCPPHFQHPPQFLQPTLLTANSESIYIWLSDERQIASISLISITCPTLGDVTGQLLPATSWPSASPGLPREHTCYQAFRFSWMEGINERYSETHLSWCPCPVDFCKVFSKHRYSCAENHYQAGFKQDEEA